MYICTLLRTHNYSNFYKPAYCTIWSDRQEADRGHSGICAVSVGGHYLELT